ncbi:50S ribosomal protein L32 [Mycoplasma sp. ES3157-GEN-MYC]|uniref:Large ribosomal subunit protein bL32 n=1 Tax=Mycoplasma miroungigenitalium TaxID=754515 RepID=A0A6M4J8T8_9MOLU|nr:50S ribosomal protein L32 [Mycoplasma miroungigenitalium]MBU4690295.1 50S ribosomal protein L32 [Mycoplasma miroungigenitalium]MBU4691562.1 50S ribosomal protein L32 [Mycoplasma miroungigenitalium]QJR43394.1 50S ribosomal protein L32 [Mycoplasma miroungigenitalium]
MAIVPKRKTSKQRKHKRRTHDALVVQNLVACKNCTNLTQQHKVCEMCGFYKDKIVEGYKSINSRNN